MGLQAYRFASGSLAVFHAGGIRSDGEFFNPSNVISRGPANMGQLTGELLSSESANQTESLKVIATHVVRGFRLVLLLTVIMPFITGALYGLCISSDQSHQLVIVWILFSGGGLLLGLTWVFDYPPGQKRGHSEWHEDKALVIGSAGLCVARRVGDS
jgi:hypothetical protein